MTNNKTVRYIGAIIIMMLLFAIGYNTASRDSVKSPVTKVAATAPTVVSPPATIDTSVLNMPTSEVVGNLVQGLIHGDITVHIVLEPYEDSTTNAVKDDHRTWRANYFPPRQDLPTARLPVPRPATPPGRSLQTL